jgi:phospholipid/cholesterol/gamma-HCH transport system substrate-binding protein
MDVFRPSIRAGLLVLAAAVVLSIGIFMVGNLRSRWENKKTVVLNFQYADGIETGSPVWYAGFKVGEVTDIRIAHGATDFIAITARINPQARVRKDSRAFIRNLGMMGAKYVEITQGSPESPEAAPGEVLQGEAPASISQVIETGQQIAQQLQGTTKEIQEWIHELRSDLPIQATLQNANAFMLDMRQRGKDLEAVLRSVEKLSESLRKTSHSVHQTAQQGGDRLVALLGELRDTNHQLQGTLGRLDGQLSGVLGTAHQGLNEAGGLIHDVRSMVDTNDENVFQLMLHLKETSRHLEILSEDLKTNPWKVVWKGDGSKEGNARANPEEWREKGRVGWHVRD